MSRSSNTAGSSTLSHGNHPSHRFHPRINKPFKMLVHLSSAFQTHISPHSSTANDNGTAPTATTEHVNRASLPSNVDRGVAPTHDHDDTSSTYYCPPLLTMPNNLSDAHAGGSSSYAEQVEVTEHPRYQDDHQIHINQDSSDINQDISYINNDVEVFNFGANNPGILDERFGPAVFDQNFSQNGDLTTGSFLQGFDTLQDRGGYSYLNGFTPYQPGIEMQSYLSGASPSIGAHAGYQPPQVVEQHREQPFEHFSAQNAFCNEKKQDHPGVQYAKVSSPLNFVPTQAAQLGNLPPNPHISLPESHVTKSHIPQESGSSPYTLPAQTRAPDESNNAARQRKPEIRLFFSSSAEASSAITGPSWKYSKDDPTVPTDDAAKQTYVRELMAAFLNIEGILDKGSGPVLNARWLKKHDDGTNDFSFYGEDRIEKVCWDILETAIKLYTEGLEWIPINDTEILRKAFKCKDATFRDRLDTLIELFSKFKNRCDKMMRGGDNLATILTPWDALKTAMANRIANDNRQKDLKKGRAMSRQNESPDSTERKKRRTGKGRSDTTATPTKEATPVGNDNPLANMADAVQAVGVSNATQETAKPSVNTAPVQNDEQVPHNAHYAMNTGVYVTDHQIPHNGGIAMANYHNMDIPRMIYQQSFNSPTNTFDFQDAGQEPASDPQVNADRLDTVGIFPLEPENAQLFAEAQGHSIPGAHVVEGSHNPVGYNHSSAVNNSYAECSIPTSVQGKRKRVPSSGNHEGQYQVGAKRPRMMT